MQKFIFLLLSLLLCLTFVYSYCSVTNFGVNGVQTCNTTFYNKSSYPGYCSDYFDNTVPGNNDACAIDKARIVCCDSIHDNGIYICDKGTSFTAEDGSGTKLSVSSEVCDGIDNDCDDLIDEDQIELNSLQNTVPVIGDYDGDGKTDLAVWRASDATWFIRKSHSLNLETIAYGWSTVIPVPGDYDGDGKTDLAVWAPSNIKWYIKYSDGGSKQEAFGYSNDVPVPGDYDGDGRTDIALWRSSNVTWYIRYAKGGSISIAYGNSTDVPVPGDYDGDGRTDIAVWRPSNVTWYVKYSGGGNYSLAYGSGTDVPVPGDYDGDGRTDIAVWRPSNATWYVYGKTSTKFGWSTVVPVPGDYDGDGATEIAVFSKRQADWFIKGQNTHSRILNFEVCNNLDDDCDGTKNEGQLNINVGTACSTGLLGVCSDGTKYQYCNSSVNSYTWSSCTQSVYSSTEICDGIDNDCDGLIDEVCPYGYFGTTEFFKHDLNGYCVFKIHTGLARTASGAWNQHVIKGPTVGNDVNLYCKNADNNYLIGLVNQDADQNSLWGYNLFTKNIDLGYNKVFSKHDWNCWGYVKNNNISLRIQSVWNENEPYAVFKITTASEICDGIDNDCDGLIDEGVRNGCGGCGEVGEVCNGLDDNCDGNIDEGIVCECFPIGEKTECLTSAKGICSEGTKTCGTNFKWSACTQSVFSSTEVCDNLDNDCDGLIDDNLFSVSNCVQEGICQGAVKTCSEGNWGVCSKLPSTEICDLKDNDCDGEVDDEITCDWGCLNCSNLEDLITVSPFVSNVIDGNIIVLDFNVSCNAEELLTDANISLFSTNVLKSDNFIESTLLGVVDCSSESKSARIIIGDCEEANYEISFNFGADQEGCGVLDGCSGLKRIYTSTSCNPTATMTSIPDNSIISVILLLVSVLFLIKPKNKN